MILDARSLPADTSIDADIVVVGAGAAGITIARELAGTRHRVVVLESGGFEFGADTQALYAGEVVDDRYDPLDATRLRYFGGSTNHWEGNCRPFDDIDFEPRSWLPHSGWPFRRAALVPYYPRAEALCETGAFDYGDSGWPGDGDDAPLAFDSRRIQTGIYRRGPPTRFGQAYRQDLVRADNVTVYLHANVVEIETDKTAASVTGLRCATLVGGTFRVTGYRYVLACGAIENARLMLLSDRHRPGGLGNDNDLVGRFFTDHRLVASSRLALSDPNTALRAYDTGRRVHGMLILPADVQRREELLNITVMLQAVGRRSAGVASLKSITDAVGEGSLPDDLGAHVRNVAGDIDGVGQALFRRLFGGRPQIGFLNFHSRVEPAPNPDNRVTLADARDSLGLRRARVDWRLGERELRSIRRTHELIGLEAGRAGIGRVQVDVSADTWLGRSINSGHHIGTLRMHDDPRQGVVDANCRVHGVGNLYVAGSAVFPTAGCSNPTLTLVALAFRLAKHLDREAM